MTLENVQAQHVRLSLLLALADEGGGYSANDSVLADAIATFGHRFSNDRVKTELAWLAEQGLIRLEEVGNYFVATITARGFDVAKGVAHVPGVKRPRPR